MPQRSHDLARVGTLRGVLKAADLSASSARAVTWLNKAMDKGSARAWSNWGGLLYVEGDFTQARKAFEHAAKGDVPQAHQYLGKLAESDPPDAPQTAIAHYERAFELGHPEARAALERLLLASLKFEKDLDVVARGIKRLQELQADDEAGRDLVHLIEDYEWRRFLAQEKAKARRLPNLPIYLNACKLNEALVKGQQVHLVPRPTGALRIRL